jgi:hypothetical protein
LKGLDIVISHCQEFACKVNWLLHEALFLL